MNSVLIKKIDKYVSVNDIKKLINSKIKAYTEHGYPFAYGIINIKSREREANINIDVEKGNYVVISAVTSDLKDVKPYLRSWGRGVVGKSYNEIKADILGRKITSLSFVKSSGKFEILKDREGYSLFFPLKEDKISMLSGHLSYNNKAVNGQLSFTSNSFLGKNGNIDFFYGSTEKVKEIRMKSKLLGIGYGDFDINSQMRYLTDIINDYLIDGEASIGYKSYNISYFTMGFGMYRGLLAGNTKYAFVENSLRKDKLSVLWRLEGDQSDTMYYGDFRIKVQFNASHNKLAFVSSLLSNYVYPIDSLPSLMQDNLCGFNGVRGYKSMSISADKFVMVRNDLLYRFNNFITAGINGDYVYYGDMIYSLGFTFVLSSDNNKMKVYIATPGWKNLSAAVISGEISYVF